MISVDPVRRMGFGSYVSPARRMGFGDLRVPPPYIPPVVSRSLSLIEMLAVQRRNPGVDERIKQFLWQISHFGGYDRPLAIKFPNRFEIPPWGITFKDSILGEVLVHPDAVGDLRMVAGISPEIRAAINQAFFEPEGTTALDVLDDLTRGARVAGKAIKTVAGLLPAAGVFLAGLGIFLLLK